MRASGPRASKARFIGLDRLETGIRHMNAIGQWFEGPSSRTAARAGAIGLLVAYVTLVSAIVLSPDFRWTDSALSDLGAVGASNAWVFNGGLIVGGTFLLAFAYGVFLDSSNRSERAGAGVLAVTYVLTVLVGVFPYPTPPHDPIALAQFLLIPLGLWVYGAGNVLRGAVRIGVTTIGLGVIAAGGDVWLLAVAATGSDAFALPELAVIVPFDVWALLTIRRLHRRDEPLQVDAERRTVDG